MDDMSRLERTARPPGGTVAAAQRQSRGGGLILAAICAYLVACVAIGAIRNGAPGGPIPSSAPLGLRQGPPS